MIPKTRLAPTPSGYLHRGNLFSFALTWLLARKDGLQILLRIDDMDRARFRPEYLEDIFRSLDSLGINYDEGPSGPDDFHSRWSQMHRRELYDYALWQMRQDQLLFACTCSRKEIYQKSQGQYPGTCRTQKHDFEAKNTAWRWEIAEAKVEIRDWTGRHRKEQISPDMAYPILRTKAQYPAYQLTSVIDDLHYKVSHIVRGDDLQSSSLIQLALAKALKKDDFGNIYFLHHPLMLENGLKLSKSQNAPAAQIYKDAAQRDLLLNQIADYFHLPKGLNSLTEILEAIART